MSLHEWDTRTPSEPMAFTPAELWRGARNTWCVFMVLLISGLILMLVMSTVFVGHGVLSLPILIAFAIGYAAVIGGGVSLIVMLAGVPIAGLIGKGLQREPRVRVHLLAYSLLGLSLGVLTVVVAALLVGTGRIQDLIGNPLILIIAGSATVAVPLGWWRSARRALLEDRGITVRQRAPRPDPDALAEDAL